MLRKLLTIFGFVAISLILTFGVLTVKEKIINTIKIEQEKISLEKITNENIKKEAKRKRHEELDIKIKKDGAVARNEKGLEYLDSKEYDRAIAEFKVAINLDPLLKYPYNNLGISYSYKGMRDSALKFFNKAIEVYPEYSKAYNNLGAEYISIASENSYNILDYKKAKPYLEKSIDLDPTDHLPYYNLGRVYQGLASKGEVHYYKDAEYNFLKAIELNYDYFHTHRQLGFVYFTQGEEEKAFKEWEIAISLGMEDESVNQILKFNNK